MLQGKQCTNNDKAFTVIMTVIMITHKSNRNLLHVLQEVTIVFIHLTVTITNYVCNVWPAFVKCHVTNRSANQNTSYRDIWRDDPVCKTKLFSAHSYISGTANMIKLVLHETALMTTQSKDANSEVFSFNMMF